MSYFKHYLNEQMFTQNTLLSQITATKFNFTPVKSGLQLF